MCAAWHQTISPLWAKTKIVLQKFQFWLVKKAIIFYEPLPLITRLFSKPQVSRGKKVIWKGGAGRCMVYIHSPKQLNKTAADASVACPHSGTSHVGVNQRRPKQVPIKTMYHIQHPKTSALQGNYIWSKIAQALWSLNPRGFFLKAWLCTMVWSPWATRSLLKL